MNTVVGTFLALELWPKSSFLRFT